MNEISSETYTFVSYITYDHYKYDWPCQINKSTERKDIFRMFVVCVHTNGNK